MSEFDGLVAWHETLFEELASGRTVSREQVSSLLDVAVRRSPKICDIEDRQSLRQILRYWASYLSALGARIPDIDIDSVERRPEDLSMKAAPGSVPAEVEGGYQELRRIVSLVHREKVRNTPTSDLSPAIRKFADHLPTAIAELVRVQRRTEKDFLSDLLWALENNVQQLKDYVSEQSSASKYGRLNELWVAAAEIFDLRRDFYPTVRQNLLDGVQHCYFIHDTSQFEQLTERVKRDPKLGAEHLQQLRYVALSGSAAASLFVFDFAIWNPRSSGTEGRFVVWNEQRPMFFKLTTDRTRVAAVTLSEIRAAAEREPGKTVDIAGFRAKMEVA